LAKQTITAKHLQKLAGSSVYKGLTKEQMIELHVDIPND